MSLKAKLETWAAALTAYDGQDFERALEIFACISKSSIILTNVGLIHAALGEHEVAIEQFIEATQLDPYLAVAYFQCGVSNFLLGRYDLAHQDFEAALLSLRGNQEINYEQLGLKFRLFSAEVLFNRGLCLISLGRTEQGLAQMEEAKTMKMTEEHDVIDDAIRDRGQGYTVFSIAVGILYRPAEKKLINAAARDFMGKARLVAATDLSDTSTGFSGVERLQQEISRSGIPLDGERVLGRGATWSESGGHSRPFSSAIPSIRCVADTVLTGAQSADRGLARSKTTVDGTAPTARGRSRSQGRRKHP
ncbi:hypothetical protein B0H10DRAFT_2301133 [Mycena sp. CBHHK59/15]|nr:hypothetical protein B0H10DRAFT_2301133 [Mycena sp. CBHHK59/15]